ncbi:hypothetical protein F0562_015096 [Nyssa sinensis]|uniref:AAA ATPase AAA+ lid domain-containing protein n=1 Tax=Nyssa sinensis TaxID=561372 RepID=A0A5J4ZJE9_9ASTE|nr:hypothetical protein F0562_015096 [Nyssa sinensis]
MLPIMVYTAKMNLSDEVDLEDYVAQPDKISAAEVADICQEAGMQERACYTWEGILRTNVKKPFTDFEFYK